MDSPERAWVQSSPLPPLMPQQGGIGKAAWRARARLAFLPQSALVYPPRPGPCSPPRRRRSGCRVMLGPIRGFLNTLPRPAKALILAGFDALALMGVLWLGYQLRLGGVFRPNAIQLGLMALAPAAALPVFWRMGLYRAVIRYLPERAIWTILWAMAFATLLWVFVLFIAEATRLAIF